MSEGHESLRCDIESLRNGVGKCPRKGISLPFRLLSGPSPRTRSMCLSISKFVDDIRYVTSSMSSRDLLWVPRRRKSLETEYWVLSVISCLFFLVGCF